MLDFVQLQQLAAHVTEPGRRFYRDLYGLTETGSPLSIDTMEEWRQLPVVTKDALIDSPLSVRSFLPLERLDHLRTSSGTSGKPPLFSPRTHVRGLDYRLGYHDFKKPFMSFTVPLMPYWHERFQREHGGNPTVIVYDPKNPRPSIALAKAAAIDAMSLFLYHIQDAGEEMKRQGINEQIKFLEVTGETCPRALYEYMRATFPNATIVQSYGASEVEDVHIGIPCKPLDGSEPISVYHPKNSHFLEIVDPATGEALDIEPGVEGDLLITAYPGEPSAFPLVRFRVGDTIRVVKAPCEHGGWSFTVLGRTDMDFVKITGGILKADEITRVLRSLRPEVTDLFTLHIENAATPTGPLLKPTLEVDALPNVDLRLLAQKISQELRVGPSYTYSQGVAAGRYLPLTCVPVKKDGERKKHLRIVKH